MTERPTPPELDEADLETTRQPLLANRSLNPFTARIEVVVLGFVIAIVIGVFFAVPAFNRRTDQRAPLTQPSSGPTYSVDNALAPVGSTLLAATPRPRSSGAPVGPTTSVPVGDDPRARIALARQLIESSNGLGEAGGGVTIPPTLRAGRSYIPPDGAGRLGPVGYVPNPQTTVTLAAGPPQLPPLTPAPSAGTAFGPSDVIVSGGIAPRTPQTAPTSIDTTPAQPQLSIRNPNEDLITRRASFGGSGAAPGYHRSRLSDPISTREIFAGTPIRLQLDDAIDTSLPGGITAHITYDVHCSKAPYPVCIPKATTVSGRYNAAVISGDGRVQIVWDVMKLPNGQSFDLAGAEGADTSGASGLAANVDDHRGRIFSTTFLSAILAAGAQLAQPASGSILSAATAGQTAAGAVGGAIAQTGSQIVANQIQRPPTLTVERGRQFMIRLKSTLVMDLPESPT